MQISIIAAMTGKRVIGSDNKLPWQIPAELQHFKTVTMGKPMIMGRRTFDAIGRRLLPGRTTILLSKTPQEVTTIPGLIIADSITNALAAADNAPEVMIVGGANIYQQFLPLAHKMYLSVIKQDYSGDVLFPEFDLTAWQQVSHTDHPEFTVQILAKIT